MMSHSADMYGCMSEEGQKRKHNEKWNKDDCTICKCKVRMIYHEVEAFHMFVWFLALKTVVQYFKN